MSRRSDRDHRIFQNIQDLQELLGNWVTRLEWLAAKGYPTGNTGTGPTNAINRPTEQAATSPDDLPAQKWNRLKHIERELDRLAREVNVIRTWTISTAKYDGPEPRPCINLECDRQISMIGTDIPRHGRCPRCAQHHRRHHAEYPHKP